MHIDKKKQFLQICIGFILFLQIYSGCSSSPSFKVKPGLEPEYLTESEKIIQGFYGNEEERQHSLNLLKERCEDIGLSDGHACYNYSVLLFNLNRYDEALHYAANAVQIKPKDPQYISLYRNLALKQKKPEAILSSNLEQKMLLTELTKLEISCKDNKEEETIRILKPLLEKGYISTSLFGSGSLSECISPEKRKELSSLGKQNTIDYNEYFYKEKSKSDPFHSFWDSEYLIRKKDLEDNFNPKEPITKIWQDVRLAVKSGASEKAKVSLVNFLNEIKTLKEKKKIDPSKSAAIVKAAYLLIEQDAFFKNQRSLLNEFEK